MENKSCIQCENQSFAHVFYKDGYNLVSCDNCDLVFVENKPGEDDLKRMYNDMVTYHFEYLDPDYNFSDKFINCGRDLDLLEKYCGVGKLLDVGCSAGFFLKVAADRGWQTHGIELNEKTAKIARDRFGLEVSVGTLKKSNIDKESLDVISLWDLIEHVFNPRAFLKDICQFLKPGGLLVLRTPNIKGLFPVLSGTIRNILDYWPHPTPPGHLFQFSPKTIKSLLASENFECLDIIHERIPLGYSFGEFNSIKRSPKLMLYAMTFAPSAIVGPWIHLGDSIVVVAKKI